MIRVDLRDIGPKTNKTDLLEYVEIQSEYLRLFKNKWIKYIDMRNTRYPGGFVTDTAIDAITVRTIKGDFVILHPNDYIFLVKSTSDTYGVLQEILIEKEKIKLEWERIKAAKKPFF